MKKLANFIKRFPIALDIAHSLGAIILTLDMCRFINSFEASQFSDWHIAEQIVFRTIGAFVYGLIISYVWEGEIQDNILKMAPSKRDAINMTACATLTGAFLPYFDFVSQLTLVIANAILIVAVIAYIKMVLNSKKQ